MIPVTRAKEAVPAWALRLESLIFPVLEILGNDRWILMEQQRHVAIVSNKRILRPRRSVLGGLDVKRHQAFTLVELLVVIGIIALLVATLLAALGKANRQAKCVRCLSNIRQLGIAFQLYLQDNRGAFPTPSQNTVPLRTDWIHYQTGGTWSYVGQQPTYHPDWTRNLNEGSVTRYLSKLFDPQVLRCPADDVETHKVFNDPGWMIQDVQYKFSYSVNELICHVFPQKTLLTGQIKNTSKKVLIVDESSETIDDGCWAWQPKLGQDGNVPSVRHWSRGNDETNRLEGKSNAGFVDGHAEYLDRKLLFDEGYYDPLK